MSISNARVVRRDGSTITVAVDTEQKYDHVTAALRTDQPWVEADLSDIVDGTTGAGTQTQKQVTKATNEFTFTGVTPPYHIGFAATSSDLPPNEQPGGEPVEPPPDPTPSGSIPQPTSLTATNITANSITLEWIGPQNTETIASGLEYDWQEQIEATPVGQLPQISPTDSRPTLQPINEGDSALMADNQNQYYRSASVTDERARLRASTKSIACAIYNNTINDFQSRQELHPMSSSPYDKIRWKNHVTWAWGYSLWLEENAPNNSYLVLGQCHDVIEYAPDGTKDFGCSPVQVFRISSDLTQPWPGRDELGVTYGSVQTKAFETTNVGKGGVAYNSYVLPDNFRGRWVDIVFRVRYDPVGQSAWPNDGVGPYDSLLEIWVDGVLRSYAEGNVPFGINDTQAKGHYPKFGIYSGFKLKNYNNPPPEDGQWYGTTQRALYSAMKMAKGANATYEKVNPSGRCTAIEVVQETAPGTTRVIATLPPSFESYTITGLSSETEYRYFTRCRHLDQTGTKSGTITVTTA